MGPPSVRLFIRSVWTHPRYPTQIMMIVDNRGKGSWDRGDILKVEDTDHSVEIVSGFFRTPRDPSDTGNGLIVVTEAPPEDLTGRCLVGEGRVYNPSPETQAEVRKMLDEARQLLGEQ